MKTYQGEAALGYYPPPSNPNPRREILAPATVSGGYRYPAPLLRTSMQGATGDRSYGGPFRMIWSVQVLWEEGAVIREAITSSRRDYVSVSVEPNESTQRHVIHRPFIRRKRCQPAGTSNLASGWSLRYLRWGGQIYL
jgi:hypothetical protein